MAKRTGHIQSLSVQQVVDCSMKYGTNGCNGGSPTAAFKYIKYNGLCQASAYSYLGYMWKCMSQYCTPVVGINKYECVRSGSEYNLQRALYQVGPIRYAVIFVTFSTCVYVNTCHVYICS